MSARELVVLGTASQAPTRYRNHNGYLLRWDAEGLLFDPGEGTQRQMLLAGVASSAITRICLTHFHGDHCLGLPGVLQRLSLDRSPTRWTPTTRPPARSSSSGCGRCALYDDTVDVRPHPVTGAGVDRPRARAVRAWKPPASTTGPRPSATAWWSPTAAACCPSAWPPPASPGPTSAACNARAP